MPRTRNAGFASLPRQVIERAKNIDATPELVEIAETLIGRAAQSTELKAMWQSLERVNKKRNNAHDDIWVLGFLRAVKHALEVAPYSKLSMSKRQMKSKRIKRLAAQLVDELKEAGLDARVVRGSMHSSADWWIYEELSESNQRRCDAENEPKIWVSRLITSITERATALLETEYYAGNARISAARFCRRLVEWNEAAFDTPMYQVVATAANELFSTSLSEQDVMDRTRDPDKS